MKKNIGVIATAFLAAAALTACGSSKPAETTAAAETSAEAAETSAAEAESSEAAEETTGDLEDLTVGKRRAGKERLQLKDRGVYRLRSAEPGTGRR